MADALNVDVAITGAIYRAHTTATVPDDLEALSADFVEMGWVGEDGVTESVNDETKDIKAWQNGTVVRSLITGFAKKFKFKAIETNAVVLETYHKGSTIETTAGVSRLEELAPSSQRWMFVIDIIDGDKHLRIVLQDAEVSERGDIVYKNDEEIGYEMTITSYPVENEDGDPVVSIKLSNDIAWDDTSVS